MSDPPGEQSVGLLPPQDGAPAAVTGEGVRPGTPRRAHQQPARLGLLDVVSLTAAFALLAGLSDSAYWSVCVYGFGETSSFLSPHVFWMAPVAQLVIFLLPGMVLAVIARLVSRQTALAHAVFWLSGLFYVNVLCLAPRMAMFSHLLLACGLAAVTARLAVGYPGAFIRAARWVACCLLVVVFAIAGVQLGGRWYREYRAVASLPPTPAKVPDILFIVLDTVRSDPVGSGAEPFESLPCFQRLAASGVTFKLAQAPSSWTLPSHASMFTGLLPGQLSADWGRPLDQRFHTLAEALASHGYLTAGFVANTHYCSRWTGLDQGFAHYEDYGFSCIEFVLCSTLGRRIYWSPWVARLGHYERHARKSAERVNADFLDWLSRCNRRPYFAFLNYFEAHHPYLPPPPFDEHRPRSFEEGLGFRHWWWIDKLRLPPEHVELAQKAYGDCLRYVDWQLGLLLDELNRRGELNHTLVVVVSDHGEHFGEHGLFLHGNSLYQPLVHVPLAIRWPGRVAAGRGIDVPVSTRHLPATIMDLVGLAADSRLPGEPLTRLLEPETPVPAPARSPIISEVINASPHQPDQGRSPVARGPMRSVLLGTMKYVKNGDGVEELYDIRRDPQETRNLAGHTRHQATLRRCRDALAGTGRP